MVDPGFPQGGGANPPGGRQRTILSKFPENCMKSIKTWAVDPPLVMCVSRQNVRTSVICITFFQRLQQEAEPGLVSEDAGSAHAPGVLVEILYGDRWTNPTVREIFAGG